ncbi:mannitol dehydrogenase family protein [Tatumella terrea]|uniref:D-arabinitol 4-dehydrogenase n=1 Tax=Tatumella terrea TaxID=419007 RepID=UPI0031E47AA0
MTTKRTEQSVWLHLGAGAFHRAHQCWYLNELHESGDTLWSVSLANIRNSSTQQTLKHLEQQQGRYTLEVISPEGNIAYKTLSVINNVILWDPQLQALVSEGSRPDTRIISFTVTEGGYFLTDDGHLDLNAAPIQSDLAGTADTVTLYGALYKILSARRENNAGPVTLLSCDNLRSNGESFRRGLTEFVAAREDGALAEWLEQNISTPDGMVDRITPASDDGLLQRLRAQGIKDDNAPVSCESFTQWVMRDDFIAGRPALEKAGVEFVDDVIPYEEAKIRVLNASHSGIAWAGGLLGKEYIDQSLLPEVRQWITEYVSQDVIPALGDSPIDLNRYCQTVLQRFGNERVRDTCQRVSSDSIAKLHEFIVPTLKARYQQQQTPQATLRLVALCFLFMQKYANNTLPFEYQDRANDSVDFRAVFASDDPVAAFAGQQKLLGSLAGEPQFIADLTRTIDDMQQQLTIMGDDKQ